MKQQTNRPPLEPFFTFLYPNSSRGGAKNGARCRTKTVPLWPTWSCFQPFFLENVAKVKREYFQELCKTVLSLFKFLICYQLYGCMVPLNILGDATLSSLSNFFYGWILLVIFRLFLHKMLTRWCSLSVSFHKRIVWGYKISCEKNLRQVCNVNP